MAEEEIDELQDLPIIELSSTKDLKN